MNNAKNILLYIFLYACVLISIGYLLRSGITELRVDVYFNVSRYLSNISKVVGPIYTTASSSQEFLLFHILTNTWYCQFLPFLTV